MPRQPRDPNGYLECHYCHRMTHLDVIEGDWFTFSVFLQNERGGDTLGHVTVCDKKTCAKRAVDDLVHGEFME